MLVWSNFKLKEGDLMGRGIFKSIFIILAFIILLFALSVSSLAADITFSGYTKYVNGSPIAGANVSIEVYNTQGSHGINSSHPTYSNSEGWWSVTFDDLDPIDLRNDGAAIKFVPRKLDSGGNVEYIGSILNDFPFQAMDPNEGFQELDISNVTFYLKSGVTVNITAIGPATKYQQINDTHQASLTVGANQERGLAWDNSTQRFAYLYLGSPNSVAWMNSDLSYNGTDSVGNDFLNVQDIEILNNSGLYFIANGSEIRTYKVNDTNATNLVYNQTYNLTSRGYTNFYSIEQDTCNTTDNLFYIFAENGGGRFVESFVFNYTNFTFTGYSTSLDRPQGKLLRYSCDYWLMLQEGTPSNAVMLDNNFMDINNGFWESTFNSGLGIEKLNNGSLYIIESDTNTIRGIELYGSTQQSFNYMVKDTRLGYGIAEGWQTSVTQASINLPADRNYSVEIFPNQAMPIYYDFNNASAYAAAGQNHVDIVFNTTSSPIHVTGRVNLSNSTGDGFQDFFILNYLFEPGDMVFGGMPMPFNMSAWQRVNNTPGSDIFNVTSGNYNITLEGTTMNSRVLMIPIVKFGGNYYAGFRNISPSINVDVDNFNFTLYPLMGNDLANISAQDGGAVGSGPSENNKVFPMTMSKFALINGSGDAVTQPKGHVEIRLEYSKFDSSMPDFTWMFDIGDQSNNGGLYADGAYFYLPLLNYSIKKAVMYPMDYEPIKLKFTRAQVEEGSQLNMTLETFDVGGIDDMDDLSVSVAMYTSSPACDVPTPSSACLLTSSDSDSDFSPLNALIGGGKISFRITNENGIAIHYKNVDMLASGPPDAMFDSESNESESGSSLEEAWRFGSKGPEIYDEVLIGVPYNESKYDETKAFTLKIAKLYDDDNNWAELWDVAANGTEHLKTNLTDYADFDDGWFAGGMNCSSTDNSNKCFVNTTTNMLWLTIPHFSGLGPQISGYAILGTLTSDRTYYSCYPYCLAYVNVSVNNTALNGTQDIWINNSISDSVEINFTIEGYNGTTWIAMGLNHTKRHFNLTYGNNQFRIMINMSEPSSTKWNFSIYVNGSYYTLDPYIYSINLTSPDNLATIKNTNANFTFRLFSQHDTNQSCTVNVNGVASGTNSTTINGTLTTIMADRQIPNGTLNWNISCITDDGEIGYSAARQIYINDTMAPQVTRIITSNSGTSTVAVTLSITTDENATCRYSTSNVSYESMSALTANTSYTGHTKSTSYTSDTSGYYYVLCNDTFGNLMNLSNRTSYSADVTEPTSTVSSSTSGSGGAVAVSKVADSKAQVWQTVPAGSSFSLKIDNAKIAVTSVAVEGVKSELKNVEIKVQALTENPVATAAAAKVYQYLTITKKNLANEGATSFKISFRVTKAWLTENGLTSGDIALYKFKDGWNELATKVTGTDA
ncbi:MAG: PGF-pre-PGF domain-containing protein, partial [Candidatus Woesearchaeota archaeon]